MLDDAELTAFFITIVNIYSSLAFIDPQLIIMWSIVYLLCNEFQTRERLKDRMDVQAPCLKAYASPCIE